MTLLANHPDAPEIRERLQRNIVLRRLAHQDFEDLAPTLAKLLGIRPLSFVDGRILTEALDPRN